MNTHILRTNLLQKQNVIKIDAITKSIKVYIAPIHNNQFSASLHHQGSVINLPINQYPKLTKNQDKQTQIYQTKK